MLIEIIGSAVLLLLGLVLFGLIFKNKDMTIADGILKGLPFLAIIGFVIYLMIIGSFFRYVGNIPFSFSNSKWEDARKILVMVVATILFLSAVLLLFKFLFKENFWGILSFWLGWSQLVISAIYILIFIDKKGILLFVIPAILTFPYALFPKFLLTKILFWLGWVYCVFISLWWLLFAIINLR